MTRNTKNACFLRAMCHDNDAFFSISWFSPLASDHLYPEASARHSLTSTQDLGKIRASPSPRLISSTQLFHVPYFVPLAIEQSHEIPSRREDLHQKTPLKTQRLRLGKLPVVFNKSKKASLIGERAVVHRLMACPPPPRRFQHTTRHAPRGLAYFSRRNARDGGLKSLKQAE